jgi:hypothetical protein
MEWLTLTVPKTALDGSMSEMAIVRQMRNSACRDAIQNLTKLRGVKIRHIDTVDFVDLCNQILVVISAMKIP